MKANFSNDSLLLKPTAFIPLLMSLAGIAMVFIHWAVVGIVPESDEGTLAHIFQVLMAAQIPVAVFFLLRWVDEKPKQTIQVIVLQAVAWLTAIISVLFLT